MFFFTKRTMILFVGCFIALFLFVQSRHYYSNDLNIYEKINEGKPFNYLIIGDSIGRGSGAEEKELRWFNQLEDIIKVEYGSSGKRQSIVQSGATAFEGIYKLQHTHLTRAMDLIFIVFGENDRKYMGPEQFSFFYEKLIRNAKELHPDAEVVTIIESPLKQEPYAEAIKRISVHYGAKHVDMRKPFKESGMLTEQLTSDMVHPNGKGYQLYASSIFTLIKDNIEQESKITELPKPLFKTDFLNLADQIRPLKSNGFSLKNGTYTAKNPGDYIEYSFSGPILGVKAIRSPNGGMVNVYIDDEYIRTVSTWWPFERERYLYITSGLEDRSHTARFEVVKEVSERNRSQQTLVQITSVIMSKER